MLFLYFDFIYVIIVEEYGIFGGFVIIGLYVVLFFWFICLVIKSFKVFGVMFVIGLSISFVL